MLGLTLGVLGAMLFGTKEGRALAKDILDSLPIKLPNKPDDDKKEWVPDFTPPLSMPEETPHHVTYSETLPPPPPAVSPQKPEYLR